MPIYEYVCLDCGERFETLRSMKDADAPITCRQCESTTHFPDVVVIQCYQRRAGGCGG